MIPTWAGLELNMRSCHECLHTPQDGGGVPIRLTPAVYFRGSYNLTYHLYISGQFSPQRYRVPLFFSMPLGEFPSFFSRLIKEL